MNVLRLGTAVATILLATGCSSNSAANEMSNQGSDAPSANQSMTWPASLRIIGDGYPRSGDPCRVVGESEATVNYLDDSATLAACQTSEQASALGGKVVATVAGITLVSVPKRAAAVASSGDGDGKGDAKVAGTTFNATADVPCSGAGVSSGSCKAGVTRGPDQIAVDVTIGGGRTRTLLFDGRGAFVTHASAEADGSAALQSSGKREGDMQVIKVGPEIYRIPDAFLVGG